ncbi:MAG: DUF6438 domain-containing protein [Anaerolineae bacterium]
MLPLTLTACGSSAPTGGPVASATSLPTASSTLLPTAAPTSAQPPRPTTAPTAAPTTSPTSTPMPTTARPTSLPTHSPQATAAAGPVASPVGDIDHVVITLERGPCFGACPTYKVTIRGTGEVAWEGKRFVKVVGPASAKISPDAVRALLDEMVAAGYFNMNDKYTKANATDMPSAVTSVTLSGVTKTIDHYYGDNSAPPALTALEKRIDEVAGTAQWIK